MTIPSGRPRARNLGLRRASGPFLSFLDDDDYFLPNKLEVQLRYLMEHPLVDLVFSRVRVIEADGSAGFSLPADFNHDPIENLRLFNVIHTNSVLFRSEAARGCRFDERLTRFTDTQFFMEAALRCTTHYLPIDVAVWHRENREDQVTRADITGVHRNLKLICEIFAEELERHPEVGSEYAAMLDGLELELLKTRLFGQVPAPARDGGPGRPCRITSP